MLPLCRRFAHMSSVNCGPVEAVQNARACLGTNFAFQEKQPTGLPDGDAISWHGFHRAAPHRQHFFEQNCQSEAMAGLCLEPARDGCNLVAVSSKSSRSSVY